MSTIEKMLQDAMKEIDGSVGCAVVDATTGMCLGSIGGSGELDMSVAAAGYVDILRAQARLLEMLRLAEGMDDILVTLDAQYHLIKPFNARREIFSILILSKAKANLALARHQMKSIQSEVSL